MASIRESTSPASLWMISVIGRPTDIVDLIASLIREDVDHQETQHEIAP
jgi:hypothetical protein